MNMRFHLIGAVGMLIAASATQAGITITYTTSAPTYDTLLTFDSLGGPQATDAFAGVGISNFDTGDGPGTFISPNASDPTIGSGTPLIGGSSGSPWGLHFVFSTPVQSVSFQAWTDAGPASFFGGGAFIGVNSFASFLGIDTPTNTGTTGPTWVNITTTDGSTISDVNWYGNVDIGDHEWIDNLSFTVPAPSSAAMLGLAGLVAGRRRRTR